MRWEREKGLPVHRVPGGKRQAVFAYREEIDAWLAGADGAKLDSAVVAEPTDKPATGLSRPHRWGLAGTFLVLIVLVAAAAFLRHRADSAGRTVVDIAFRGNALVALDEKGNALWSRKFPREFGEYSPKSLARRRQIVDLDGDGQPEVLVAVPQPDPVIGDAAPHELWCFSMDGQPRWHFAWDRKLRFGVDEFGPAWGFTNLRVYPAGNRQRILYSVAHIPWWGGALLYLDEEGKALDVFVNSGHINETNFVETQAGRFLLAGGTSNANNGAMLAVLDESKISGSSPEVRGSPFECLNCPAGKPLRYFVFPRSEVNRVTGAGINQVIEIAVRDDRITARTFEQQWYDTPGVFFEFSKNFILQQVRYSDGYWDAHRKLELEGKLRHSRADCPERHGPGPVRMWTPQRGWSELRPLLTSQRGL
jgi:hypothetical protein